MVCCSSCLWVKCKRKVSDVLRILCLVNKKEEQINNLIRSSKWNLPIVFSFSSEPFS